MALAIALIIPMDETSLYLFVTDSDYSIFSPPCQCGITQKRCKSDTDPSRRPGEAAGGNTHPAIVLYQTLRPALRLQAAYAS